MTDFSNLIEWFKEHEEEYDNAEQALKKIRNIKSMKAETQRTLLNALKDIFISPEAKEAYKSRYAQKIYTNIAKHGIHHIRTLRNARNKPYSWKTIMRITKKIRSMKK